jgi:hypothetical protein
VEKAAIVPYPFRKISKPIEDEYRMKEKIKTAGFVTKNSD